MLRDNVERGRFELQVGGDVVFATYRREPGQLVISRLTSTRRRSCAAPGRPAGSWKASRRTRAPRAIGSCPCAATPGRGCAGIGRIATLLA
ncbi:MAG: N-acetyltransferase [Methylobacterium radiotolerans]